MTYRNIDKADESCPCVGEVPGESRELIAGNTSESRIASLFRKGFALSPAEVSRFT